MSRKDKLEKALAFDKFAGMKNDYVDGRQFENSRLASLHAALIEAVEALEWVTKNYLGDIKIECSRALSEIDKVLEEK